MKQIYKLLIVLFIATGLSTTLNAQNYKYKSWRAGAKLGLGYNMAGLGYQNLSSRGGDFIDFVTNDGTGIVPYFGIYGEYLPDSWWGLHLGLSYDSRNALVYDETFNPASEFDLVANYFSIEPKLVINQNLIPQLRTYLGPTLAFNLNNEYSFKPNKNNDVYLEEGVEVDDFSTFALGLNLGFAYDILLSDPAEATRYYISPFVETSWLAMQRSPDFENFQDSWDDTWGTVSIRAGVFASIEFVDDDRMYEREPTENFLLTMPLNDEVIVREVEEIFPIVNHVFFDQGSQDIPSRYIRLTEEQADDFDEEDILDITKNNLLADRSRVDQQMFIYYNVMNIYGDRMKKNKGVNLQLIGSAPLAKDGGVLAQKVKDYLVSRFDINEGRIEVVGQESPRIPSGTSRTPSADRPKTEIENRRVEFVFDDESINREAEIRIVDKSSIDNDLIFALNPGTMYENWNVVISGEERTNSYGPFYNDVERINPVDLLADLDAGQYVARVVINKNDGTEVSEETNIRLIKLVDENIGQRFTILFNYAQQEAVKQYENTLRNEIADIIPASRSRVIVHGHTDALGQEQANRRIAIDRANEVKTILDDQFKKDSKNVAVEAIGFGERIMPSTFNNDLPEGRFYNRNVIIDVVPQR